MQIGTDINKLGVPVKILKANIAKMQLQLSLLNYGTKYSFMTLRAQTGAVGRGAITSIGTYGLFIDFLNGTKGVCRPESYRYFTPEQLKRLRVGQVMNFMVIKPEPTSQSKLLVKPTTLEPCQQPGLDHLVELINSKCLTSESPVNEDKDKQREKERVNRIIERMGLSIAQVVNGTCITSVVSRGYLV